MNVNIDEIITNITDITEKISENIDEILGISAGILIVIAVLYIPVMILNMIFFKDINLKIAQLKQELAPFKKTKFDIKYSPYDEDYYLREAKKIEWSQFSEFRASCFFAAGFCASTLIGLLVCWIPLIGFVYSFPYTTYHRRRTAYKLYIIDCLKKKSDYIKSIKEVEAP